MSGLMQEITDEVGQRLVSIGEAVRTLADHTSEHGVMNLEAVNALTALTRIEKDMKGVLETFGLESKEQR